MLDYNHLKSVSDYFFWHFLTRFSKYTHNQLLTIFIRKFTYVTAYLSTKYNWTTTQLKSKWWTKTKTLHWHVIFFNLEKLTGMNTLVRFFMHMEIYNGKIWHLFFSKHIGSFFENYSTLVYCSIMFLIHSCIGKYKYLLHYV